VDYLIDFCFVAHIGINLRTAITRDLRLITDGREIAANYAKVSPKRCSHSDAPLYFLSVLIRTKYTGVRQNDSNV
jgi:hypothetical protein